MMETQQTIELKQEYCSKSALKSRGWTDKLIELFLKSHDKESKNPYYSSASPVKLYLLSRVEDAEKTSGFQEYKQKNERRKDGSKQAVITKKEKMCGYINNITIELEKKDYPLILKESIASYNNFKQEISYDRDDFDFQPASLKSDQTFLKRILVNYIRHQLTEYDIELENIFGRVGKSEAYNILNKKIYDKISEVYPSLKDECDRQLSSKTHETNY